MKNPRTVIRQPIDYFIKFERLSDTLKGLHRDHFYRFLNASELLKVCSVITEHGYDITLRSIFPHDEGLRCSLEAVVLLSAYQKLHEKKLAIASADMEAVNNEADKLRKAELKKKFAAEIKTDRLLQEIVSDVKKLTFATIISFYKLKIDIQGSRPDSILIKKI